MDQTVVVLEKDPAIAHSLAGGLRPHFSVRLAGTRDEVRDTVTQKLPEVIVLNIEFWRLTDVESLHRDFPELPIVCTHRVPDETMWMAALEAGASDVCPIDDVRDVIASVQRHMALTRGASA